MGTHDQPHSGLCGFMAQLVGHCTSVGEAMGSNPLEVACIFQESIKSDICLKCYKVTKALSLDLKKKPVYFNWNFPI